MPSGHPQSRVKDLHIHNTVGTMVSRSRSWPSRERAEEVRLLQQHDHKLLVYPCPVQNGYWHLAGNDFDSGAEHADLEIEADGLFHYGSGVLLRLGRCVAASKRQQR